MTAEKPKTSIEPSKTPAPAQPATPAPAPAAPIVAKGARSYLTMMVLATILFPTGLARAYRGEQIGWVRFWVYVGAIVTSWIPFINFISGLVLLVLSIWGAVDVFILRKTKTDTEGAILTVTDRDEKFAKGFFIYFIVMLILSGIAIVISIIFGMIVLGALLNGIENTVDTRTDNPFNNSSSHYYFDSYSR